MQNGETGKPEHKSRKEDEGSSDIMDNGRSLKEIDMKAKIVTFDIENMANLLWSWQVWSQNWNAIDVEMNWHVMCFAYKWFGKKAEVVSIWDQKGYKPMVHRYKNGSVMFRIPDERAIMQEMWNILDEADVVVGWNSTRFDVKKVQAKMVALGMTPPSPFVEVDVMTKKKQICASNSNKLDDTGEEWGLGRKLPHQGWPLWLGCAEGDVRSQKKMERYNIQDVNLTEKAYIHLRPWMKTHPNLNVLNETPKNCPRCGAAGTLRVKSKSKPAGLRKRYQYYCRPHLGGCGGYPTGGLVPIEKKIFIR